MSGPPTSRRIEEAVAAMLGPPGRWYWLGLAASGGAAAFGAFAYSILFREGLHRTGLMRPVGWGVLIVNFVFWVGIAHAGTLISAILFLFRARFRTAINRVAEMMTVFAVLTAGLFPLLHLGRPWFAYWLAPLPNQRGLWVNFRSPLVWDLFAVSIYLVVSSIFLLVGVIPDAAALRDRGGGGWRTRLHGALALGWRGTDAQWRRYTRVYLLLAALVTPLVVSVHSIVAWDFAVSVVPGWHSTIFPPYFVAGAILSGVAMVVTVLVPLRRAYRLEDLITDRHLERLGRLVLLTALIVAYCDAAELAVALGAPPEDAERSVLLARMTGPTAPLYWLALAGSCLGPLLLLWRRVRGSAPALLAICLGVNVGMWLERFVIVVASLSHDRLPFGWRHYTPSWIELGLTLGAFGWFFFLVLVGLKLLPPLSIAELKEQATHGPVAAPPGEARHAG
jgi:molybdopterin-containing oxidoreductase family membrane subunit